MNSGIVFLIDVDNTLMDTDCFVADLHRHLDEKLGNDLAKRYWAIFDAQRCHNGYVDYLGSLQLLRRELEPNSDFNDEGLDIQGLQWVSDFLIDYPFAERLYPQALDVLAHLGRFGQTVILTDGDAVFQPRKVKRSGLWNAVDGRVLIYINKERKLADVKRHYPAEQYVMIDDKLRILAVMKAAWGERVTTIFPRQGHYAHDPYYVAGLPAADLTIEHIGELTDHNFSKLLVRSPA